MPSESTPLKKKNKEKITLQYHQVIVDCQFHTASCCGKTPIPIPVPLLNASVVVDKTLIKSKRNRGRSFLARNLHDLGTVWVKVGYIKKNAQTVLLRKLPIKFWPLGPYMS